MYPGDEHVAGDKHVAGDTRAEEALWRESLEHLRGRQHLDCAIGGCRRQHRLRWGEVKVVDIICVPREPAKRGMSAPIAPRPMAEGLCVAAAGMRPEGKGRVHS
jgi:hypothetical protein